MVGAFTSRPGCTGASCCVRGLMTLCQRIFCSGGEEAVAPHSELAHKHLPDPTQPDPLYLTLAQTEGRGGNDNPHDWQTEGRPRCPKLRRARGKLVALA